MQGKASDYTAKNKEGEKKNSCREHQTVNSSTAFPPSSTVRHAINPIFISGNARTGQIMDPSKYLIYCDLSYFRAYGYSSDINTFLFLPSK